MQFPTHGQWWSNLSTQLLQILQCEEKGGLIIKHVLQNFWIYLCPFINVNLGSASGQDYYE